MVRHTFRRSDKEDLDSSQSARISRVRTQKWTVLVRKYQWLLRLCIVWSAYKAAFERCK